MRLFLRNVVLFWPVGVGSLFGQGPTLSGSGYSSPAIWGVAPGQITTLFVTGLQTVLPEGGAQAETLPAPTSLAGLSLELAQPGRPALPVPLLSLRQISVCSGDGDSADCLITALTVQIPFELQSPPEASATELTLIENGLRSRAFRVLPVSTQLHILNWCDDLPERSGAACGGIVAHADGAPVTADAPAQAGETVVIYAYGLGTTTLDVATGEATPATAPGAVNAGVETAFDFRANALPSPAYGGSAPLFAGLTPGQLGLYQINVRIPEEIPPAPACSLETGVVSNLTIDVSVETSGGLSSDGAPICVEGAL
ncbi:MAG: hypothetical protein GC160_02300 [Acidobacteria bacterium]|nr:hypothetical protein [Acidobacteriota bacterium]